MGEMMQVRGRNERRREALRHLLILVGKIDVICVFLARARISGRGRASGSRD